MTMQTEKEKLLAKLQALRDAKKASNIKSLAAPAPAPTSISLPTSANAALTWNPEQLQAISYGEQLKGFVLIGAAGTGKTTTIKQVIKSTLETFHYRMLVATKHVPAGSPAIALVSFTNRAVKNIKKAVNDIPQIAHNVLTIHKLLEFKPEDIEVIGTDGSMNTSRRFVPTYCATNPISDLRLVIIDESSMVDTRLFKMLKDACPNAVFIFIGDLNQLPPVFGDAILGFKLCELPVVELHRVYRQAMQSPIVAFQHDFTLKGRAPGETVLAKYNEANNGLIFKPFKMKLDDPENMSAALADFMRREYAAGSYDWKEDIILIPYNKAFGSVFINREISQWLGDLRGADIHEVHAGMATKYFAVGDFVLHNKNEYVISSITPNNKYVGKQPKQHSPHLRRDGTYKLGKKPVDILDSEFVSDIDMQFDALMDSAMNEDEEGKKAQASHSIELVTLEDWENPSELANTITLKTMGELSNLDFGYCITVHKSQGSEWRKVYFILSNHHAPMLSRELIYTGMTRAKENLMVIYSPESQGSLKDSSVGKAILRQRVAGRTWKDKVEVFKGKYDQYAAVMNGTDA